MNWINVKDSLPNEGESVDIYIQQYDERWTDYEYIRNHLNQQGNDFFEPKKGGLCTVRNASHWMYVPKPPKN